MTEDGSNSAALVERERQLKEDVFPYVVRLPTFLGNVDYQTDFYRFHRPGQVNWEFHDKKTKATFHTFLLGEVADATHGTKLGALGNKHRTDELGYPFQDGTKIKNIIVLRCPAGSTTYGSNAFHNQFIALEQIVAHVNAEDTNNTKPSNGTVATWVASTVAFSETHRPTDLIDVTLPRKYDSPPAQTSGKSTLQIAKRLPVAEREDYTPSSDVDAKELSHISGDVKVHLGGHYEPRLLPDFSSHSLAFVQDKLVQHDVRDVNGELIPAWKVAEGLRPGSVVGVKATLHVYNIPNQRAPGFRRFYQIDAEKIRVMSEAIDPPTPAEPPPYSSTSTTVDDFDSYRISKRPATPMEGLSGKRLKKSTKRSYTENLQDADNKMFL